MIGQSAGRYNTTADNNVFVGSQAGQDITTGDGNVFIGFKASGSAVNSQNRIAIGSGSYVTADNSTAIGNSSQTEVKFGGNVTIGDASGNISGSASSTGSFGQLTLTNANGDVAIRTNYDGAANVIIGDSTTGAAITTGADNVIIGQGIAAVTGENNVYIGAGAAAANTSPNNCVVIGYGALSGGTGNERCVAVGMQTLKGNGSGYNNSAFGHQAGKNTTTGEENTFLGYVSGDTNTTGDYNVTLGAGADVSTADAQNQIAIGRNVTSTGDNQTVIGNSDQTHVVFGGSALISGSATSTGSFGIIENNTQIAGFRPILNQTANFSASLSNAGRYHIVHGNITCSIGTDSDMPLTTGAEFEFFQSSSVGNFLFETGSGVSLLSKNDNKNIAGQHSGATLKKVAANTFHLVGDLT
jgi:hypothetical protein